MPASKGKDVDLCMVQIITGPTASGKSSKALALAKEQGGVVINADSMQIYNALPILTACPDEKDKKQVPHKLYAVMDASEQCSAAKWRELAIAEIEKAHKKRKVPVICGGTGLYILALIEGLSPIPEVPEEVRESITNIGKDMDKQEFYNLLVKKDPVMAERLNPNDSHRIHRALEVLEHTGQSLSYWQSLPKEKPPSHMRFNIEVMLPTTEKLRENISTRFDQMMELGVIDEIKDFNELIAKGDVPENCSVTNSIGYKHLSSYINGEMKLEEAKEKVHIETRQYAKRQITWSKGILAKAAAESGIETTFSI